VINFRYHIVSLMAVFLALSVGIVLGVSFGEPVSAGIATQAEADRRQVQTLRAELDRRNALDEYREAWATRVGQNLGEGVLSNVRVGVVAMPDAPAEVVDAVSAAVTAAGGSLTSTTLVNTKVFDPAKAADLDAALVPHLGALGLDPSMSGATRFGRALGRALGDKSRPDSVPVAEPIQRSLSQAALVDIDEEAGGQAALVAVVTAEAAEPRAPAELLTAHVEAYAALKEHVTGVVLAGPNSEDIEGTDVLAARNDAAAVELLSTVDVADLASGVSTTVLAGKEQLLGRQGHYGALTKADSPLPELPVR